MDTNEKILWLFVTVIALTSGYSAVILHQQATQVIAVDCNQGEPPTYCQARLGNQFEVIYNAQTGETWAELK